MKNQSGRSMVEILAVMAIMGVLSVTGIYAYNLAIIKHKANELIHKANLAYMDVLIHDSLDSWTNLKITSIDGTPLQGVIYKDAGFVLVDNVDKDVCNAILNDKTNFSLMQTTNVAFTACETINSMVFDFANAGDFGAKCISGKCPLEDEGQYCSTNTNTCIMETTCPDGEWNFDIDACGTCESVNGDLAPVSSENGCISCAESTNDTKPIWDDKNKTCVNCLIEEDCDIDSYCKNNMCTLCPENSKITGTGDTTSIPSCKCINEKPWWNDNACKSCNTGYEWNGSNCVKTIETKCTNGFIVTTNNTKEKYCVSNIAAKSAIDASNWCTSREMQLIEKDTLCPNNPEFGGNCPNLSNLTAKSTTHSYWIVTTTPYNDTHKYMILIGPSYRFSSGHVYFDDYYSTVYGSYIFTLCR